MKKRKKFFQIAITIMILITLIIGITFAYYASINNSRAVADVNVGTGDGQAKLKFDTGDPITLNINLTTLSRTAGNPTIHGRPKITLEDIDITDFPTSYYYAYLNITDNDFEYDIEDVAEVILQIKDPNGTAITTHPTLGTVTTVTDIDGNSITGFDITTFTGLIPLAENYQISVPRDSTTGITTHIWQVDIVYVNMNINQIKNQNKTLNAEFILQAYKYGTDPFHFTQTYAYDSNNQVRVLEIPKTGYYLIELWGAQGNYTSSSNRGVGGKGAYTKGYTLLEEGEKLYFYIGENRRDRVASFNAGTTGGDQIDTANNGGTNGYGGGGATDVRYFGETTPTTEQLEWDSTLGLNSRIMVAAGGGGASDYAYYANGGAGGALTGHSGANGKYPSNGVANTPPTGGTQTAGGSPSTLSTSGGNGAAGSFGKGGNGNSSWGSAGGGGWYGGGGGGYTSYSVDSGAGGSSYISGYQGCIGVTAANDSTPKPGCTGRNIGLSCSYHYSEKIFLDAVMISGTETMPTIDGVTEIGHTGSGSARILYLGNKLFNITLNYNYENSPANGDIGIYSVEQLPVATRHGYTFLGWYDAAINGNLVNNRDELEDDMTLYAHWEEDPYADYTLIYSINSLKSFANGQYEDTPWTINWNKDFVVLTDFKVDTSGQRYLVLGNYNSTNELNVEIYNDMIRLYSGGDIATGSKSIPMGKFVHLELTWNHTTQNLTANLSWDEDTDTANGTKSISGTSSTTIRIGAQDRRGDSTTFKAITYNNMYIYEHN